MIYKMDKKKLLSLTKEEFRSFIGAEVKYGIDYSANPHCSDCVGCITCENCKGCTSCVDCTSCTDCRCCTSCMGLKGEKYVIFNIQLTEEEYKNRIG